MSDECAKARDAGQKAEVCVDPAALRFGSHHARFEPLAGTGSEVVLVEDRVLKRRLTLREAPGTAGAAEEREFLEGLTLLCRLDHPYLRTALDAGRSEDGRVFFVQRPDEGVTIDVHCAGRGPGLGLRCEYFLQVCDAVQYAHDRNVVHGDLGPSRVLILDHGSAEVFGWESAVDLAAVEVPHRQSVRDRDMRGLGALLDLLLDPVEAAPPELLAVARACHGDRPRYRAVRDLAADVRAWMVSGEVGVYRGSTLSRLARAARRRPGRTVGMGMALLGAFALLALGFWYREALRREAELTQQQCDAALRLARNLAEVVEGPTRDVLGLRDLRRSTLVRARDGLLRFVSSEGLTKDATARTLLEAARLTRLAEGPEGADRALALIARARAWPVSEAPPEWETQVGLEAARTLLVAGRYAAAESTALASSGTVEGEARAELLDLLALSRCLRRDFDGALRAGLLRLKAVGPRGGFERGRALRDVARLAWAAGKPVLADSLVMRLDEVCTHLLRDRGESDDELCVLISASLDLRACLAQSGGRSGEAGLAFQAASSLRQQVLERAPSHRPALSLELESGVREVLRLHALERYAGVLELVPRLQAVADAFEANEPWQGRAFDHSALVAALALVLAETAATAAERLGAADEVERLRARETHLLEAFGGEVPRFPDSGSVSWSHPTRLEDVVWVGVAPY